MEGAGGPHGVDGLHICPHEGSQQLGVALDIGQAPQDAHLGLVGHSGIADEGPPGVLLRLRGGDRCPGLRSALTPRGCAVPSLLGTNLLLSAAAGGHQADQQVPAQVLVDVETAEGLASLHKPGDDVELFIGDGVSGQGSDQLELLVASGLGRPRQLQ